MYLTLNEMQFPCSGTPALSGETLRFYLPDAVPEPVGAPSGVLRLYQDDGFQIWEQDISGYLRWAVGGNTLVITNLPVPEPEQPTPDPQPVAQVTMEVLSAAVVDLQFEVDKMKLERLVP